MSDAVKGDGAQRPARRADQARATRRRIIAAAADLFVRQGYASTTLEQIAGRAGVAVQTVYFHFGNKRTVLKEVADVAAVGDDAPVALLDRPWVQQMRAERDAARVVTIWLHQSGLIFARVAPILGIIRDASSSDPDMAAQWEVNQQQRRTAHRMLALQLADRNALRRGMSVDQATDILFALISLEVYALLTTECGWTPGRWERWTARTVIEAVLHRACAGSRG